jgi:hypothetical protein
MWRNWKPRPPPSATATFAMEAASGKGVYVYRKTGLPPRVDATDIGFVN